MRHINRKYYKIIKKGKTKFNNKVCLTQIIEKNALMFNCYVIFVYHSINKEWIYNGLSEKLEYALIRFNSITVKTEDIKDLSRLDT